MHSDRTLNHCTTEHCLLAGWNETLFIVLPVYFYDDNVIISSEECFRLLGMLSIAYGKKMRLLGMLSIAYGKKMRVDAMDI